MQEILSVHKISICEFDILRKSIIDYRNKFVAHLDEKETAKILKLALAYLLVWAYYRKLLPNKLNGQSIYIKRESTF